MRNTLFLLVCLVSVTSNLRAQITLESSDYPITLTGTDSLKVTTAGSAFPSMAAMAGGLWDMSVVTDSTPVLFACRVRAPPYQFADSSFYTFAGFNYQGNVEASNTVTGIINYGKNVRLTSYSIASLTGGGLDSLIIPAQTPLYSAPYTKIAFPATYNSSWSSSYRSDVAFQLTYLAEGDTLAPGMLRTYIAEKDSVTGWGKMRVTDAGGSPSAYLNVLQVRTMIMRTDSVFLNGAPLSFILLSALHLQQGVKDTIYLQNYYRTGEVTPLAQVAFRDAGYTQPYKATTHVQRLVNNNVGVPGVAGVDDIRIYPNPVAGSVVHIALPPAGGEWGYELTDIAGTRITAGVLHTADNTAALQLPPVLAPGIYYLKVGNGRQAFTTPLEIGNR